MCVDGVANYSVLMSVYIKEKPEYLRKSIMSIFDQTVQTNDFVLVCDGELTDDLNGVINDMQMKYGDILNVVRLPQNVGLGSALNEGIKHCKNNLIARMDSDDISHPERCEKQLAEFKKNPDLDIVGCSVKEFVDTTDNIVGMRKVPCTNEDIYKFGKKRSPFNHPTVMYKKSFVEKVGCYGSYRKSQDLDLWVRMLSGGAVCMNLDECLFWFRFDSGTFKKRKSWVNIKAIISIRWKAFRTGFCSLFDFMQVAAMQLAVYIMPVGFQKLLYEKVLRK